MALAESPPFWWKRRDLRPWLLFPASYLYGLVTAARMDLTPSHQVPVPVICVGNFIVGGGGKTPTVQMFANFLKAKGLKPGILSRGHGGAISDATRVDPEKHNSLDVGDEALLHANIAPTVVSADRPSGADLLVHEGCDIIVMDDGFQNPSLVKDFKLVVVDSKRGLGNGFVIPAGPLRVPVSRQIPHLDALLVIGRYRIGEEAVRSAARGGKPTYQAAVEVVGSEGLAGAQVLAFAGIADPSKFFDTVAEAGAQIGDRQAFGDHHVFNEEECENLLERAAERNLTLVTTSKDYARLDGKGKFCRKLREMTQPVLVNLVPDNPEMLDLILETATRRAAARNPATA